MSASHTLSATTSSHRRVTQDLHVEKVEKRKRAIRGGPTPIQ